MHLCGDLQETVDTLLMVGLTAVMSLGIGYMADILKERERAVRVLYEAACRDALTACTTTATSRENSRKNILPPGIRKNP